MSRKLHIGGKQQAEGWEILNANPGPNVDHVCNAINLDIFDSDTFSDVYASHVLEHFDYMADLNIALKEWNRVLTPGGTIHISVPDLDVLATMLTQKDIYNGTERFHIMRMLFGGHIDQYDFHQVGLNLEFLSVFLIGAEFENIKQVKMLDLFNDTSCMLFKGIPISLNVTANKKIG
jgi:predicted SAM-dependent methyltransferase